MKFNANLLVINTHKFDVILEMDWLNTFHAVIDGRKGSNVFKRPYHLKFECVGGNNIVELTKFRAQPKGEVPTHVDVIPVEIMNL